MTIVDCTTRSGAIDGVAIVTMNQATDARGALCEPFRRSAFADVAPESERIEQKDRTSPTFTQLAEGAQS